MRDLFFVGFLLALIGLGFRRPFLMVLTYAYVDIVAPQRLTYILLNSVPISLILAVLSVMFWLLFDDKRGTRFAPRQALMLILLIYCAVTTTQADYPVDAADKFSWVWKALAFAIFLPMTLRTRLRIEAMMLFMVLSAASIIIVGGIKTLASGGGYGALNLMVDTNTGLYESSTVAMVAIAIIPIILWLAHYGTIFRPEWRVRIFATALIVSCLLIPVGTEARTGLICIGVLGVMMLRSSKRRMVYLAGVAVAAMIVLPNLPKNFTERMDTIKGYQGDSSASTRVAVWNWTLDYVHDHPMGGGFNAYLGNSIRYEAVKPVDVGGQIVNRSTVITDKARAYHSAYFEMLGEQGWPGLILWILIHFTGLVRMEILVRRHRRDPEETTRWIAGLATALQQGHFIYLVGSLFVGIAYQPFVYMLVATQIGLDGYSGRLRAARRA